MNNISLAANGYYDEFFTMDFLTASAEMSKRQLRKKCSEFGIELEHNESGDEGLPYYDVLSLFAALSLETKTKKERREYDDESWLVDVEMAADILQVSKRRIRKMIRDEILSTVKVRGEYFISCYSLEAIGRVITLDELVDCTKLDKATVKKKCSKYGFKLIRNKAGEEGLFECDAGDLMDCLYDEYTTI